MRNIYFPFDVELDTALSVATEMVEELDITDQDVTCIADMIDEEIALLVPDWKKGVAITETPRFDSSSYFQDCSSEVSIPYKPSHKRSKSRFEEITYHLDSLELY